MTLDTIATAKWPVQPGAQFEPGGRGSLRTLLHRLREDAPAQAGAIVLLVIILAAVFAPNVAPLNPIDSDVAARLRPPLHSRPDGGWNVLGTDPLGRDVFSRVIYGARISLIVGFVTVFISAALGLVLGVLSGYAGGRAGAAVMRLIDVQLSFPFILLAIAVVAVIGPGLLNIVLVLGVAGWVIPARVIRAEVLKLREQEFVQASRALGGGPLHSMIKHIVPNVVPSLVVIASFTMAQMIIMESSLSFVGVGVPPPTPTWGSMLADGQNYLTNAWWVATMPGIALMVTVLSVTLVGDFLRDVLDPSLRY
jgi:peptide/nickel transport system permease protein